MSEYKANITEDPDGEFYALVVRIEDDGCQAVVGHYKGRHFATRKNAERSTAKYIAEYCQ